MGKSLQDALLQVKLVDKTKIQLEQALKECDNYLSILKSLAADHRSLKKYNNYHSKFEAIKAEAKCTNTEADDLLAQTRKLLKKTKELIKNLTDPKKREQRFLNAIFGEK